jgi:L-methionine (R)-S-oxide reductase
MAEKLVDVGGLSKAAAWAAVREQVEAVLSGLDDEVAAMATVASIVHHAFGYLWTGFYRVVERDRLLRVGPYQGTLGCMEIEFGKGVCGTSAKERRTLVVKDVHAFPGHITCDGRSRSEIVAPVFDKNGALKAVFDIDSDRVAAFDEEDRHGIESLLLLLR